MSNLFDAQTKDVIESRMTQTLHTITEKEQSTMEGTFARDLIDANAVEFESSYEPTGPFGAKSIGEIVINSRAPALTHAIANATGLWFRELPITSEQIAMGIMENEN